jgi:Fuc2NAc and GlcNAc transferase
MKTNAGMLFGATAALSFCVTWACRVVATRNALLDRPNARSAHTAPKPRLGGVGVIGALLMAASAMWIRGALPGSAMALVAVAGGVAVVGLVDDLRSLSARRRFAFQFSAAALIVGARWHALPAAAGPLVGPVLPAWLLAPLAVLWIVWLTNLYNFMDGIDGLAGGQALIGGLAIAVAAAHCGAWTTAALTIALAGASLGFLFLNFPPSSIFMGDVGSTALGFFFGCVPLLPEATPVPIDVVGVALALFVLDATVTLVRRVAQGQRWYEAHRSHYYQRPLALGIGHRPITLSAYLGFGVVGTFAVAMRGAAIPVRLAAIAAAVLVFVAAAQVVRGLERAHARATGTPPANGTETDRRVA